LKVEKNVLTLKNNQNETSLAVVRDVNNTVVALGGQVAPESSAKVLEQRNSSGLR
jgi:hypothetical protein